MVLTMEMDRAIEKMGLGVKETNSGYVMYCKSAPDAYFKEDALRILTLYSVSAAISAAIEWTTFEAATTHAWRLEHIESDALREGIKAVLLSAHPEALAPLITAGGLACCGIENSAPCLHEMKQIPASFIARLFYVAHVCNANLAQFCAKLALPKDVQNALFASESLLQKRAPVTELELKMLLSQQPEFAFDAVLPSLCMIDETWTVAQVFYETLLASNEPYLESHLAFSRSELPAKCSPRKQAHIMRQLLQTVIKEPSLNTLVVLRAMAKSLL